MAIFSFLRGAYLWLLLPAIILHLLLAIYSPAPYGYIYDFYFDAIDFVYLNGRLPTASDCFICYHPPLLPVLGAGIYHVVDWFGGERAIQLTAVAFFLNALSIIFAIFTFSLYRLYRKQARLDCLIWALILFLPITFISAFSIESDILASTFIVIATYYFVLFLRQEFYSALLLTAIFIGLAALTKYTGLLVAVYFGLVLLLRYLKNISAEHFKQGLAYAIVAFMVGAFPYLNNLQQSGKLFVGNGAWNTGKSYSHLYRFTAFNPKHVIDTFTHPSDGYLDSFGAYNRDVLTSHYGQLWTDFSLFTRENRNGTRKRENGRFYGGKYMPTWLLWGILSAGLIPMSASLLGFAVLAITRKTILLHGMFVLCIGVYINWFIGHTHWMLKLKYLLYLLPLWFICINKGLSILPIRLAQLLLIPSIVFSALYCFYFAVF